MNRTGVVQENVNCIAECLDLAIPHVLSDQYAWTNERWTYGSLPNLQPNLLELYGRQFTQYSQSTGLYDTMVYLKTLGQIPEVVEIETIESGTKFPDDSAAKNRKKSFWKRLRRYLQKRTKFIRRLFKRL